MADISFYKQGSGKPVILIHGFPMNQMVWGDFAKQLAAGHEVYTPDLPGFGKSQSLPVTSFTLDDVATAMLQWMADNKIENSTVIGHSLGGYVALAMVRKNPSLFQGLGLFHSTAYADGEEKKESRTKVLKFVDDNGVLAFTSNFIPPLFANQQHPAIGTIRDIAIQASADAVKGYTVAMRDRPDSTDVIKSFKKPVLFIAGARDGSIPADTIKHQASLCALPHLHVLDQTAHMGMLEKTDQTLAIVNSFLM